MTAEIRVFLGGAAPLGGLPAPPFGPRRRCVLGEVDGGKEHVPQWVFPFEVGANPPHDLMRELTVRIIQGVEHLPGQGNSGTRFASLVHAADAHALAHQAPAGVGGQPVEELLAVVIPEVRQGWTGTLWHHDLLLPHRILRTKGRDPEGPRPGKSLTRRGYNSHSCRS